MGTIRFSKDEVGVFSENLKARLDIGGRAMKKTVPASHDSWATRLRIERVDGVSEGPVDNDHLIRIVSENGKVRLDIGSDSMKETVPSEHLSWATRLKFKPIEAKNSEILQYGDVVGLYSSDFKYRLDLGSDAVEHPADPDHESWATRLRVQDADPIVECGMIHDIEYHLDHARIGPSKIETVFTHEIDNDGKTPIHFKRTETSVTTETHAWSKTWGVTVTLKTTITTGIPRIEEGKIGISVEGSYEYNNSETKTETKDHSWSADFDVLPGVHERFGVVISVTPIEVPYTLTGEFKHLCSGDYTHKTFSGTFRGTNSHDLKLLIIPINKDGTEGAPREIP
jgi:hypothetical protein